MCCLIKRHMWVRGTCAILLLAFVLVAAGCGDSVSKCGNGIREVTEFCDGVNLGEQSCVTLGFGGGSLGCQADCTFDTSGCTSGPVCGDNVAQASEICDGTDLAGLTCADFGFTGGTLACNPTCNNVDITGCTSVVPAGWTCPPWIYGAANGCECGCGVIDLDCADATVASCERCGSPGSCSPIGFDSACPGDIDPAQNWLCGGGAAVCGDDVAESLEVCDGIDVRGVTCVDLGFIGGALACNATCTNVDTTDCTGGQAGWTCPPWSYGAADGCDCGCGVIDLDCADATVASCEFCGYLGSCSSPIGSDSGCPGDIDPAQNWLCGGGTAVCGNNVAEVLELCDGSDLRGATCVEPGFTGGTLACNPTCNNVDITGCTSAVPVGWTCLPWFYGADDGCDCGCGVVDLDCADATVASCEWCSYPGSCSPIGSDSGCPGDIDPAQNWLCGG